MLLSNRGSTGRTTIDTRKVRKFWSEYWNLLYVLLFQANFLEARCRQRISRILSDLDVYLPDGFLAESYRHYLRRFPIREPIYNRESMVRWLGGFLQTTYLSRLITPDPRQLEMLAPFLCKRYLQTYGFDPMKMLDAEEDFGIVTPSLMRHSRVNRSDIMAFSYNLGKEGERPRHPFHTVVQRRVLAGRRIVTGREVTRWGVPVGLNRIIGSKRNRTTVDIKQIVHMGVPVEHRYRLSASSRKGRPPTSSALDRRRGEARKGVEEGKGGEARKGVEDEEVGEAPGSIKPIPSFQRAVISVSTRGTR